MSSRRHKSHGPGGVNLGLIITPMLDMSFQILSFFIMTYHPSALEGHIAGSLAPPAEVAKKGEVNKIDEVPQSVDPELLTAELQDAISVKVTSIGGKPDKIALQQKADPAPRQIADATLSGTFDKDAWKTARRHLGDELKRLRGDGTVEKSNIKIAADGDLRQEYVMEIYDTCKQAQFSQIHFVPPPVLRKSE
jgi:biopolymer transport protein ExbD